MRRHSLVARLGPSDSSEISLIEPASVVTEIHLVDGYRRLGYGIGGFISPYIFPRLLAHVVCDAVLASQ